MIQSDFPTRQPAPKIGENGTWLEWDELTQAYVDSGVPARGDAILTEQDTDGFYINRIVDGGGSGGGGSVTVDDALSSTSDNPVQNKVIKAALDGKANMTSVPASGSISSNGLISFKNADNTQLFTVQLPLYAGGVS